MKQLILSVIWAVVATMPALNAQQASPGKTTAPQRSAKPKVSHQVSPQPVVHPRRKQMLNIGKQPITMALVIWRLFAAAATSATTRFGGSSIMSLLCS